MRLAQRIAADLETAHALAADCGDLYTHCDTIFAAEQAISRNMGATLAGDVVRFSFWTPELLDNRVPEGDVFLELMAPEAPLDLTLGHRTVRFDRVLIPTVRHETRTFAAVRGAVAGRRDRVGDFYALVWRDGEDRWHRILDPLAMSLPFGAFAPAEIYDVAAMQAGRGDAGYFAALKRDRPYKFTPPVNILQIHVPTATAGGTLASLTRYYQRLSDRVAEGLPLEPSDEVFVGYDAVQLLPVEPTTVYETGPAFWQDTLGDAVCDVTLTRPDTTNWGYDTVISGMGTVNPVLLETGRPDELVDFASVLHNFASKPKKLILDVVFGHSDNQGLAALNAHFFAGPNMYGQNLAYQSPAVRAILLELQRRKVDFGADGVRVDGAQDFKNWNTTTQCMEHDDDYLQQMADVEQNVAGTCYRPWFIFEDGRPWPDEDWELSSTYRSVIEAQNDDDVFQWGPLTFAHNTPFLYTFWLGKYWRIREILEVGENWISGTSNHDTLRRGTQVSLDMNINTRLGTTHMDILDKAYDNPAVHALTYGVLPGVPMDFLNATARASWGFIRNQDDKYGVKVVAEEVISLKWQVDEYAYSIGSNFRRLKELGFATRDQLARFFEFLPALVEVTDYDLDEITSLLSKAEPPLAGPHPLSVAALKQIARAWMDDMHEYCNVAHHFATLVPEQTGFTLALRNFRRARPWLRGSFGAQDHFDYRTPIDGRTLFRALRHGPKGEQVFAVLHMEGKPTEAFDPLSSDIPGLAGGGWELALRTPSVDSDYSGGPIELHDSMALIFTRNAAG